MSKISQRIRTFGTRVVGEAAIGLSPTIGRRLTLPLLQRVRTDFPELRLRIAEGFSGTLLEWLRTGRVDAAIIYDMPPDGSIRAEAVANEPLSLIDSASSLPFPAGEAVSVGALAGRPLMLPTPAHGLRKKIDQRPHGTIAT